MFLEDRVMKIGDRVVVDGKVYVVIYAGLHRVDVRDQVTGIEILAAERQIEKLPRINDERRWQ